jgi:hypothetical protein
MIKRDAGFSFWTIVAMVALTIAANTEAAACSGPGAAAAIRRSSQIGLALAGSSFLVVGVASVYLARRGRVVARNVLWGLAAIHPGFWESATRGDCGYSLVVDASLMTLAMGVALPAALMWPRRGDGAASKRQGTICGGLAGAIPGLLFVFITLSASFWSPETLWLAGWSFVSIVVAGALWGRWLCSPHDRPWYRPRFRVRSMMIFLLLLAPILAVLLPTRPYEMSTSLSTPTSFIIVDEKTRQPVTGAEVWLFDLRYAEDNLEMQHQWNRTGAEGRVDDYPDARVIGRVGLLGRTETTSFVPLVIRVDAPNYQRFQAPLNANTSIRPENYTDPPLGLAFPPPTRVVIGLKRKG